MSVYPPVQDPPPPPIPEPPSDYRDAQAKAKAANAYAKSQRPWYKKKRFIALGLFGILVVISIATSGSNSAKTTTEPGASAPAPAASSDAAPSDDSSCGSKATDDCTPNVASDQPVRVDALTWKYVSSRETSTLGDQQYGLGAKADDVFLVVKLTVTSNKDESATLTDDAIKLESSDGNTYSPDSEGTIAAMGSGEDPMFLTDLAQIRRRRASWSSTSRSASSTQERS
jgi:hypothetical protein